MCECVREIEAEILASVKEQYQAGKHHVASLDGQALRIPREGGVSHWVGFTPVSASVMMPLRKNPDAFKVKKIPLKMYFTYCPYCGVKYVG